MAFLNLSEVIELVNIKSKRILVTGGNGFLGKKVVSILEQHGCQYIFAPRKADYDLRDNTQIINLFNDIHPEIIIHSAAVVGGIGANLEHPGNFFYDNLIMGVQLIEQARLNQVVKFVSIGTVWSYPKFTPIPFKEEDLWNGYPE